MNRSESDGEGERPEAPSLAHPEYRNTPAETQEPINAYRLQNPLPDYQDVKCLRCSRRFNSGCQESLFGSFDPDPLEPVNFQLCFPCYQRMFFTGSKRGLALLNKRMGQEIPQNYLNRTFRDFDVSGPYGRELAAVRDDVVEWTKAVLSGSKVSFFLYSEFKSPSVTGNGVGKTLLASTAYQYIAKQRCEQKSIIFETPDQIDYGCQFIDMQDLVFNFLRQKKRYPDDPPSFPIIAGSGSFRSISFDGYLEHLADRPILFLDDIGQGATKGMLPAAYEALLDLRATWEGPTFFTSNFSLESLGAAIGTRAVSRLRRLNCCVRELQIPDYHLVHQQGDIRSMVRGPRK